jgi:chromosome segregation ATPase
LGQLLTGRSTEDPEAVMDEQPVGTDAAPSPQAERREEIRPAMSTWDQAFSQLQARVSNLIESIEGQTKPAAPADDAEPEPSDDRLSGASEALQTSRSAERAELPLLIERLKAKAEPPSNLSGIVASLPEITAEQRQALSRIDHRLELMKVRTDATADALGGIVREIEHLRSSVEDLGRTATGCQQTEAELAANQRQMAESLNLLHDLVARATETIRSNAAWVEMLAEAPDNRYQAVRDHVTGATARVETKSTITLITSGLAAAAAIVAIVLTLTK